MSIQVVLNGEERNLPQNMTLTGLVAHLGLPDKGLGIELNARMVLRDEWENTVLGNGDKLEMVRFVGGG